MTLGLMATPDARIDGWIMKFYAASGAMALATTGVLAHAAGEMAARSTGRTRLGMRVAMFAYLAMVAHQIVMLVLHNKGIPSTQTGYLIDGYIYCIVPLASVVGLAIAAGPSRGVVLACLAVWLVTDLPPHLANAVFHELDLGPLGSQVKFLIESVLRYGAIIVLFAAAPVPEAAPAPEVAIGGFRRAANALWLHVIGAVVALSLGILIAGTRTAALIKFSLVAGAALNLAAFAMFAYGAFEAARSALRDVPRIALAIGGVASAWCAGVIAIRIPGLYQIVTDADGVGGRFERETLGALQTTLPIIAMLGGAIVAKAISQFATRRSDLRLAAQARFATVAFVLLSLASVAIQTWALDTVTATSSFLMLTVMLLGTLLAGQVVLAKLCSAASAAVESDVNLPAARVVE
jgi:hypothetical protein